MELPTRSHQQHGEESEEELFTPPPPANRPRRSPPPMTLGQRLAKMQQTKSQVQTDDKRGNVGSQESFNVLLKSGDQEKHEKKKSESQG